MKPLFAALLCASAIGAASAPALAQPVRSVTPAVVPGHDFREQLQTLEGRLNDGIRDRTIDRGEFDRATRELNRIKDDLRERRMDGMSEGDRLAVQRRIDELGRSIHWMRVNDRPPVAGLPGHDFREQLQTLETRLNDGIRDRTIDRGEFDRATRELNRIKDDMRERRMDGMSESDRMVVQRRIDELGRSIHWMRVNDRPPVVAGVPSGDFRSQLQTLQDRLDAGIRERTIDRGEFDRATRELTRIRDDMRQRWSDGRMDEGDRMQIQRRIDELGRSIHWMRETGRPPLPGPRPGSFSLEQREDWLQQRIERGRADATLDRRTAWRAEHMLSDIRRDQARLMRRDRGVLTPRHRDFIEQRLNRLRDTVRSARDAERAPW